MRHTILALLLMLSFHAFAAQPTGVPDDKLLQRILAVSQMQTLLTHVAHKRDALRGVGATLGAREGVALDKLMEGVFLPEEMSAAAKAHFMANWDVALASRAASLFEAQPQVRLLRLEAGAGSPLAKPGFRAYWENPGESASKDRIALLLQIDELVLATDWMSAFQEILIDALAPQLEKKLKAGSLLQADYDAIIPALRKQAAEYRDAHPGVLLLAYAYSGVPTADMEKYLAALQTPEGRWLLQTSRGALVAALRPSLERYAANMAGLL